MKKYLTITMYALILCVLNNVHIPLSYAHGDHDHDDVPVRKKATPPSHTATTNPLAAPKPVIVDAQKNVKKEIIAATPATPKPLPQIASQTLPQQNTAIKPEIKPENTGMLLTAKVVANPSHIRYLFSQFDGLLSVQTPIIAGQTLKKGQFLGKVTSILNPMDASNQANQIAALNGEIKQQQAKLNRYQLVPELVAKKEIDEARLSIQNTKAQLKAMQAPIRKIQSLVAPISGIVTQSYLNANKGVDNKTELLQMIPSGTHGLEIHAEYYLTNINFNPSKQSQAFLLNAAQKIPLIYLGHMPFIQASNTKNSVILRFSLPNNEATYLILGQSLNIEFQPKTTDINFNQKAVKHVK